METLVLSTSSTIPVLETIAVPMVQRFPESCQRSSLLEDDDVSDNEDAGNLRPPIHSTFLRESSPSSRFYHRETHRRASYSPEPSYKPPSSFRHTTLPSRSERSPSSRFYSLRSASLTPDSPSLSFDVPSLSDSESSSSNSSDGPHSPLQTAWLGLGPSVESMELSSEPHIECLPSPMRDIRSESDLEASPKLSSGASRHGRSLSEDSTGSEIDIENHSTFSKVVVTKFSNPPRYRLKKVKFHECPICQKSFPRPSGLRTHMNMHTNTKPYACPHEGCDKSFSVISNAKRHYRTHLVELSPDQIGLPSEPYTVNFSDPVVLPEMPPHEAFFTHAEELSSGSPPGSSYSASSSSSSLASLDSSTSSLPTSPAGSRRGRVMSEPQADGARLAARSGQDGPAGGRRRHARAKALRWLPLGADSRLGRERTTSF